MKCGYMRYRPIIFNKPNPIAATVCHEYMRYGYMRYEYMRYGYMRYRYMRYEYTRHGYIGGMGMVGIGI